MKSLPILLSLASAATGLWAAYRWWQASRVGPRYEGTEPGTPEGSIGYQLSATWMGMADSAKLNAAAARWTAIASLLGAASALAAWLTA
jgi:hypothetical protein